MGENANVYLLKLLLFIKLWTIISESYMYRLQTHLKTANHAIKMCSFWVGRLEAKSKCTDMTSTSDRSRTTEDRSFFITVANTIINTMKLVFEKGQNSEECTCLEKLKCSHEQIKFLKCWRMRICSIFLLLEILQPKRQTGTNLHRGSIEEAVNIRLRKRE